MIAAMLSGIILSSSSFGSSGYSSQNSSQDDKKKQKESLELVLKVLRPDNLRSGRVSFLDETFKDWLNRTGELPPDFDKMPSLPFLPDPFITDEGGENIPVETVSQWQTRREEIKGQLKYYITGTFPPAPDIMEVKIISEEKDGQTILRMVELSFGPGHQAKMTAELMIPPGEGPFPVFITQWNHREWAQLAVRRGYIGCVYAGADSKDDSEKYSEIWAGEYDFTRLMRRAWGASRVIDYLYTLPVVDKDKIGITGHSRNGKLSMMAAAFDERITACVPSSGGTGSEVPWRYCSDISDGETIADISTGFPSWFHPRLRFFIGRENKLPVDQNLFMALIAPRGLMLSTAISEGDSNPWGIEQAYLVSKKVYKFLGSEDKLAIRSRYGLHSVSARDMEDYIDFFDYVFGRTSHKPANKLFYYYSFEKWLGLSGEMTDPEKYPAKGINDILQNGNGDQINSVSSWESRKTEIQSQIRWSLGEEPAGVTNPGPGTLDKGGRGEGNFGTFLTRPGAAEGMGVMAISPYNGFGDQLFGYLYYPSDSNGKPRSNDLPVVIYLHEFDYSKGFSSTRHGIGSLFESVVNEGYAVFAYDMIGFGNRIEEGTRFYQRYPSWSKMGKMVADVRGAVDALENLDFIDGKKIYVSGYSLGAVVGLYSAALDERIAGAISVAGFTPMRTSTPDPGTEGIRRYSHLHGLIPRLGFFIGHEDRIPYDFHEVLGCIAPRPVLVIAPMVDKDAHHEDVVKCVDEAGKVYGLYRAADNINIFSPNDINRFSPEMRDKMYGWLAELLK